MMLSNELSELDVWKWGVSEPVFPRENERTGSTKFCTVERSVPVGAYPGPQANSDSVPTLGEIVPLEFFPVQSEDSSSSLMETNTSPSEMSEVFDALANELDVQEPEPELEPSSRTSSQQLTPRKRAKTTENKSEKNQEGVDLGNNKKKKPKTRSKSPSGKKSERSSCARWTQAEEIILEGVATDCSMLSGGAPSWEQIADYYNRAAQNFAKRHLNLTLPKRSICGLRKHYRIMHMKARTFPNLPNDFWYTVYHFRWMADGFNKYQKLVDYRDFQNTKR